MSQKPTAIVASEAPLRQTPSIYPEPFYSMMKGREKRVLGDRFGLTNFGVNQTRLEPGARSALRHYHATQDEFIYVLSGHPVLVTDAGETPLSPGMCAGFPAGEANGHALINPGPEPVVYLEIGDRSSGDAVVYPDDDLAGHLVEGKWRFTHKDGSDY